MGSHVGQGAAETSARDSLLEFPPFSDPFRSGDRRRWRPPSVFVLRGFAAAVVVAGAWALGAGVGPTVLPLVAGALTAGLRSIVSKGGWVEAHDGGLVVHSEFAVPWERIGRIDRAGYAWFDPPLRMSKLVAPSGRMRRVRICGRRLQRAEVEAALTQFAPQLLS